MSRQELIFRGERFGLTNRGGQDIHRRVNISWGDFQGDCHFDRHLRSQSRTRLESLKSERLHDDRVAAFRKVRSLVSPYLIRLSVELGAGLLLSDRNAGVRNNRSRFVFDNQGEREFAMVNWIRDRIN